jgi:HSP20 family protein
MMYPLSTRFRWTPVSRRRSMNDIFDRLFPSPLESWLESPFGDFENAWNYPLDLVDKGDHMLIQIDVPGLKKDQINISLDNDILTIGSQREEEKEDKSDDEKYYRRERYSASFQRRLRLPGEVDGEKISANLSDGVLEVKLPKAKERLPREVKIEST